MDVLSYSYLLDPEVFLDLTSHTRRHDDTSVITT